MTQQMSLFEALYGRKWRVPNSWDNLVDKVILGHKLLKETEQAMVKIRKNLKISPKIDKRDMLIAREPGDHVYL
jgi:hypothetical protein